jgi:hypothetical protein
MPKYINRVRNRFDALCSWLDPHVSKLVGLKTLRVPPIPKPPILMLPSEVLLLILQRCRKLAVRSTCRQFRQLMPLSVEEIAFMKVAFFNANYFNRALDRMMLCNGPAKTPLVCAEILRRKSHSLAELKVNSDYLHMYQTATGLAVNVKLENGLTVVANVGGIYVRDHLIRFYPTLEILEGCWQWTGRLEWFKKQNPSFLQYLSELPIEMKEWGSELDDILADICYKLCIPLFGYKYREKDLLLPDIK